MIYLEILSANIMLFVVTYVALMIDRVRMSILTSREGMRWLYIYTPSSTYVISKFGVVRRSGGLNL